MESIVSAFKNCYAERKEGSLGATRQRYLHGVYYNYQIPWDGEIVELEILCERLRSEWYRVWSWI